MSTRHTERGGNRLVGIYKRGYMKPRGTRDGNLQMNYWEKRYAPYFIFNLLLNRTCRMSLSKSYSKSRIYRSDNFIFPLRGLFEN